MSDKNITRKDDCWQCRLTGTAAFAGVSIYASYVQRSEALKTHHYTDIDAQSRFRRATFGFRHGPKWLTGVSATFAGLALMRLLA
ncbi:hypothetical protein MIR68_011163 [Amoeboaphelidium protococcarum]|nr:hypothetical protein MIR68_011163 [Amoeboaphelidium protococcarum]